MDENNRQSLNDLLRKKQELLIKKSEVLSLINKKYETRKRSCTKQKNYSDDIIENSDGETPRKMMAMTAVKRQLFKKDKKQVTKSSSVEIVNCNASTLIKLPLICDVSKKISRPLISSGLTITDVITINPGSSSTSQYREEGTLSTVNPNSVRTNSATISDLIGDPTHLSLLLPKSEASFGGATTSSVINNNVEHLDISQIADYFDKHNTTPPKSNQVQIVPSTSGTTETKIIKDRAAATVLSAIDRTSNEVVTTFRSIATDDNLKDSNECEAPLPDVMSPSIIANNDKHLKTSEKAYCFDITGPISPKSLLIQGKIVSVADINNVPSTSGITPAKKGRVERKAIAKVRKAILDFKSDDEQEDFSPDSSSDEWVASEDKTKRIFFKDKEVIVGDEQVTTIKKKEKKINVRKSNKKLKETGLEYTNTSGNVVAAKFVKPNPCLPDVCKRGCFNISEERRNQIFSFFWNLDTQRRRDWLIHCARVGPIKRKKTDSLRRSQTFDYYINDGEGFKKVCQKFIINTLDITQRLLLYTINNNLEGMSKTDMRKRNYANKHSEGAKNYVRTFIENLPALPSHYNRKKSKRLYLPQVFKNMSNLYRIYCKDCEINTQEIVTDTIFREIFNGEYDIGFHTPKKDKCALCTKIENLGNEISEAEKLIHIKHIEEKEASYSRFKAHQELKDVHTVCSSFDLQKVLNTPFGESMLLYYARKYAVFNFTVYESIKQDVYCYTWGESDGKRGSIEMASCLMKYLKEIDAKGFQYAILYCDSCTGQNKNKVVLSVLNYFLNISHNLKVIQINYLLPGHTYMPADSVHATIEAEVKKIIVWSPTQWASYFETARKKPRPYNVEVMEYTDFVDWDGLAAITFTTETCKNIKFKDIRVATFRKKDTKKIEIKYSMKQGESKIIVDLFEKKRTKGKGKKRTKVQEEPEVPQELAQLLPKYKNRLPISEKKYKDLQKLCTDGVIPKRFHRDFLELPYDGKKQDFLIETDEEDEVLSDNEI